MHQISEMENNFHRKKCKRAPEFVPLLSASIGAAALRFPMDVILDILVKLPTKSLVRFKSVCKAWCRSVNDPKFVRDHLDRVSSKYEAGYGYKSILTSYSTHCKCYSVDYEDNSSEKILLKDVYPLAGVPPNFYARPRNSCHGLLVVTMHPPYYPRHGYAIIWNPSTREFKRIDIPRPFCGIESWGIAYDGRNDDYKVLRAPSVYGSKVDSEFKAEVFSLKNNSWKTVNDGDFLYAISEVDPITLNGRIHWLAQHFAAEMEVILYFDASEEIFGELLLPDEVRLINYSSSVVLQGIRMGSVCVVKWLLVFQGCVGLVTDCHPNHINLWSMKDYGMSESWVKLYTVPYSKGPDRYCFLKPLGVTSTGIVVLSASDAKLVLYDAKNNSFKNPAIDGDRDCLQWIVNTITYVESLVSPVGGNWIGKDLSIAK